MTAQPTRSPRPAPALPAIPEPTELELELTNHCNARCVACPRGELTATRGFMEEVVFQALLEKYARLRDSLRINALMGERRYPFVTFAGMGEPLLHPRALDYIAAARARGFKTVLFTNASTLTRDRTRRLVDVGLDALYVSFWGIEKDEYEQAMGLHYEQTLARVEHLAGACRERGIPLSIIWVANPHLRSKPEQIAEFWGRRGVAVDQDNEPWNRGGYLAGDFRRHTAVDFTKPIWCSQLYFADTICWNGDAVICSCDYYERRHVLGNVRSAGPADFGLAKLEVLRRGPANDICARCLKPDRNYSFGSAPWDEVLPPDEKGKYAY